MERTVETFSALAICIAGLGLFGLAAFAAEQRTKEVGVRKVLGATVTGVIALLSRDFVKLVLIANIIAWPVAWFAINKWLQGFAYRVDIQWWLFALAGGLVLLIALLTVSTQAIKAALANPVESLRYE
jgi:putative ABC transport system permease protein